MLHPLFITAMLFSAFYTHMLHPLFITAMLFSAFYTHMLHPLFITTMLFSEQSINSFAIITIIMMCLLLYYSNTNWISQLLRKAKMQIFSIIIWRGFFLNNLLIIFDLVNVSMHFHLPHVITCNQHPLYTGMPMTYTTSVIIHCFSVFASLAVALNRPNTFEALHCAEQSRPMLQLEVSWEAQVSSG